MSTAAQVNRQGTVSTRSRFAYVQPFLPANTNDYDLAVRVMTAASFDELSDADQQALLAAEASIYSRVGSYQEDQEGPRFRPGAAFGP